MATNEIQLRKLSILLTDKCKYVAAPMALAVLLPVGLLAQTVGDGLNEVEEVVVTGSRIPRTGFETLQPATVLDSENMELRGTIDLASVLNEQAGFAVPAISPVGGQAGDTVGQNFVDFLGLGQQRTLTLVNGQRFPAGISPTSVGGLSVDLNSIPENLVDRVETIAVGGAPIYGADAIAGTVNIIIKQDFDGLALFATSGTSPEHGDATRHRGGITWGKNFDNGRGNITLSGQYSKADGLKFTDRPATATDIGFESPSDPNSPFDQEVFNDLTVAVDNLTPFPLFFGDQFRFNIFGNGIPLDINDPNSPITQFDRQGNLIPFVPGGGTGSVIFQDGGDGLKLASLTSLFTDSERYNGNVFFNYDVTDTVRFKAEGWYTRSTATEIINQPTFNSPAFGGLPNDGFGNVSGGPIPVLMDNPFLPEATRSTILAALNVAHDCGLSPCGDGEGDGLANPTIDTDGDGVPDAVGFWRGGPLIGVVGDNPDGSQRDTYRAVFGFDGDIDLGGRNYAWDVTYAYGRTESDDRSLEIIQPNFEQAIQVVPDANGNPVCADPSNGCVPLNVIGENTPEAVRYVSATVVNEVTIEQRVFNANIAGDIFDLPAGPVGAAAGFAYREEEARFDPNDLAENGFTRNRLVPINGQFDSTEFYVETVVPLLGGYLDTPLVETLEFEGAVRLVDNSVAGNDTTWTAGLRYRPIADLEFRGNVTESIRAPSVTELFTPESSIFVFANDPCDERFIGQGNVPATRSANCGAAGITQPFQSFIVNASQEVTLSGNPNLDSEIAESYTFGFVVRPSFIDGLTASFDWFDIEITNAVENLAAVDILNACYDSAAFPNEPSCDLFTRDANGQIIDVRTGFVNVGLIEFAGLQSVISYDTSFDRYGDFRVTLNHLYTDEHLESAGTGNTDQDDGEIGESEHRVTASAIWTYGDWTLFNQLRWFSSAVFDNSDDPFTRNVPGVDDWHVLDTSIGYAWNENIDLQLNIDNILDKKAPYPAVAAGAGISTYYAGVLERFATVTVRARF